MQTWIIKGKPAEVTNIIKSAIEHFGNITVKELIELNTVGESN